MLYLFDERSISFTVVKKPSVIKTQPVIKPVPWKKQQSSSDDSDSFEEKAPAPKGKLKKCF